MLKSKFYYLKEKRAKKYKDLNFSDFFMTRKGVKSCSKRGPFDKKKTAPC
jgi:hypothetical protein